MSRRVNGGLVLTAVGAALYWGVSVAAEPAARAKAARADRPVGEFHFYHFKEQRPLTLDVTRVAVLFGGADAGGAAERPGLDGFGLDDDRVSAMAVPGWHLAPTKPERRSADGVAQIMAAIRDARVVDFVSPVFVGLDGGPVIVTPYILVGFDRSIDAARAEAVLAAAGAGEMLDRDWANMPRAYRVKSTSRSGSEVLEAANRLARLPEVEFAEPDMFFTGRSSLIPNDTFFSMLWGLHNTGQSGGLFDFDMDAPEAWDITTGDPAVIVVIIDIGVQQDHPDLHQLTPGIDTTSDGGDGGPVNACDLHGTPVAGCVSAIIDNDLGVVGVAPGCRTASARTFISTLDCSGSWSTFGSWTVNTLAWAESIGARVTNNSNGYGFTSSAIAQKYEDTRNAGMVHFASAMNDGQPVLGYPSSLPTVNAVAALNRFGSRAWFSNYGTGLAFSAPGESIVSTDRTGSAGYVSGDYVTVDGTSFASPYAAGVAGLILSVDPNLSAFDVESIMQQSCVDMGPAGYDTDFGWGQVNAKNALSLYVAPPLPAPYPHDRLKNRCISFDPNVAGNGTANVAFKIELIDLKQGSCNNVESSPCRYAQGTGLNEPGNADCRRCASGPNAGQPCISSSVDCVGAACNQAAETCSNNDPATGASNLAGAVVRWAGTPTGTTVYRMIASGNPATDASVTKQAADTWPSVVHICDCEIVPQATFKVTTVAMPTLDVSTALNVSTIARPATGVFAWWADAAGSKANYCNNGMPSGTACDPGDPGACNNNQAACVLGWGPSNGFTNADDIVATLSVFNAFGPNPVNPVAAGAMATPQVADITWIDMHDVVPNRVSNASDVQNIGLAFAGRPYPFPDPVDCP